MKKICLMMIVACSCLALIGCCASTTSSAVPAEEVGTAQSQAPASGGQMPPAMQLALGTLLLDKTEYPVDAKQAAQLLPLWQAALSIGSSDTAAAEEISGLFAQINETMTPNQLEAIQAMDLKMKDLSAISQELGIDLSPAGSFSPPSSNSSAQSSNQPPAGGFDGPMPGDGGDPGAPPGGPGDPAAPASGTSSGSNQASGSQQPSFMGLSSGLLDQLIQFLQARAQ
jgi:hypothetical protein